MYSKEVMEKVADAFRQTVGESPDAVNADASAEDLAQALAERGVRLVEVVDPTEQPGDVVLTLTLHDGGVVEVWQREGRTGREFADLLRQVADDFESGDVRRVS